MGGRRVEEWMWVGDGGGDGGGKTLNSHSSPPHVRVSVVPLGCPTLRRLRR